MVTKLPFNVPRNRLLTKGPFLLLSSGFKKVIDLGEGTRDWRSGKKKGAEVTEP